MMDQNHDDTSAWKTEPFPSFYASSDSSQSPTSTSSRSEKSPTNNHKTLGSESPPDLVPTRCRGRASGCHYPEDGQPHCHLRCSPRACKQCREVLDADCIDKGRRRGAAPRRQGRPVRRVLKVVGVGALVLWCMRDARADWALFKEWAAGWAQL
ncbi:hypothetical protein KVR01_004499 [Diaporthe batatas]|uniref:uncharacterized protein n=1 Tax=Diaporthe batatas TaxID=748121 RepID=UPI001D049D30|nr:uncharacterized protein KVR01_004499 [Diaporthe batatas]KAG8165947.1 hypothetical protein KVR01_004499 [Diaporthe batatas]